MSQQDTELPDIIQVQDLRKSYGDLKAVDGVSFSVQSGEVFGILGPNGAGKTTTVEILEGMRAPDSGTALINGTDVQKDPRAVKKVIGIQLQSSAFFDRLNLAEILDVMASLYGREIDASALLGKVELAERAKALFKELSGGQKQRFSVATTLVNDPVLLFKEEGRTVLLTTHYMEEAEELCDRVAIMDHGKIVAMGRPAALVESLLSKGFQKERTEKLANLEDVFLDLTGRGLRDD